MNVFIDIDVAIMHVVLFTPFNQLIVSQKCGDIQLETLELILDYIFLCKDFRFGFNLTSYYWPISRLNNHLR